MTIKFRFFNQSLVLMYLWLTVHLWLELVYLWSGFSCRTLYPAPPCVGCLFGVILLWEAVSGFTPCIFFFYHFVPLLVLVISHPPLFRLIAKVQWSNWGVKNCHCITKEIRKMKVELWHGFHIIRLAIIWSLSFFLSLFLMIKLELSWKLKVCPMFLFYRSVI